MDLGGNNIGAGPQGPAEGRGSASSSLKGTVIYVPVPSFASAGVPPPWYGLTMECRAHLLCYVGNSFMSRLCFTTQCAERSITQGGRVR